MKAIKLILMSALLLHTFQTQIPAQDEIIYKAQMLIESGNQLKEQSVEISLESDCIKIRGTKKPFETKYILFSEIENADYTYSERPRYTAGTVGAIVFGVAALPVFFMKTKKNWLTINAEKNSAILQLQDKNYRMLLLAMNKEGIKITDSGDNDEQEKSEKELKKNDTNN